MKYFNPLILSIFLGILSFAPFSGKAYENFQKQTVLEMASPWQEVLNYAQENLPKEGQLIVKSDGFGYLKVDDRYIHTLFPLLGLKEEGFNEPPYFRSAKAPGAHISVFYANEHIVPEEVGKYFHFELTRLCKKICKIMQPASTFALGNL